MLPLLLLLVDDGVAAPQCTRPPTTSADVVATLEAAHGAYRDLDLGAFRDAVYELRLVVPCLRELLTAHDAAEIHRVEGLLGFVEREQDRAQQAFAAARRLEPNYRFPESIVPAGNGALVAFTALDPDSGADERVAPPHDGRLLFDGLSGPGIPARPLDFPTVVQLVDGLGAVSQTAYLWPGDPLPPYQPRVVVEAPDPLDGGTPRVGPGGPHRGLLTGAAYTGVAAAALYAGAFVVHRRYEGEATPFGQLGGLRTVNNALVVSSGAAAGLAVGLGITAVVAGQF